MTCISVALVICMSVGAQASTPERTSVGPDVKLFHHLVMSSGEVP